MSYQLMLVLMMVLIVYLGQDLIRIQDSYYYQDYSYEVQVGESFSTYVNELKKAVHPAGFQPFGRVTIATLVFCCDHEYCGWCI